MKNSQEFFTLRDDIRKSSIWAVLPIAFIFLSQKINAIGITI